MTADRQAGQFAKLAAAAFLLCLVFAGTVFADSEWQGVERIVAVGDIHGDYDNFVDSLREAGLINRRRNWIGGSSHLVQVGDVPDRGPDTDKVIDLLQKLERQAAEDGGQVHALIGNHEAMNILGDLRYVHPEEYEAFRNRNSRGLRDRFYAQHVQQLQAADPEFVADDAYRKQFDERFPLGYVEHRFAWAPEGEIGSWVLQHNAVIKINRNLFLHGGLSPQVLGMSIEAINEAIRSELGGELGEEPGLSEAEHGPLWYRGLAQNAEAVEAAHVDAVLQFYDVDRIIIGHTPGMGTVVPRFDGKVLVIDTGLSTYYGGYKASLEIATQAGVARLHTLQAGERIGLADVNRDEAAYYQRIVELLPNAPAALQQRLATLQSGEAVSEPVPAVPD